MSLSIRSLLISAEGFNHPHHSTVASAICINQAAAGKLDGRGATSCWASSLAAIEQQVAYCSPPNRSPSALSHLVGSQRPAQRSQFRSKRIEQTGGGERLHGRPNQTNISKFSASDRLVVSVVVGRLASADAGNKVLVRRLLIISLLIVFEQLESGRKWRFGKPLDLDESDVELLLRATRGIWSMASVRLGKSPSVETPGGPLVANLGLASLAGDQSSSKSARTLASRSGEVSSSCLFGGKAKLARLVGRCWINTANHNAL